MDPDPPLPAGRTADPEDSPPFRVEVVDDGDEAVTIAVTGELDLMTLGAFRAAVDAVLVTPPRRLLFDLRQCPFTSVRGFSVIGCCCSSVEEVVVFAASPFVARVIPLLGFDQVSTVLVEGEPG